MIPRMQRHTEQIKSGVKKMHLKELQILGLLVSLGVIALPAHGHGYVSSPPSRNLLCKQGKNVNCGALQYEPQSLEALSGYPSGGPADGRIASASQAAFSAMDEQTITRWAHQPMQSGVQNFSWTFTANHVTRNWRYYITRQDWNPNQTVTRAAFESTPFCTADGNMQKPPMVVTHSCNVPSRNGYQLILAVWEVGDTVNSFYNLIDADFKGGTLPTSLWEERGTINPSVNLDKKDVVQTRVFDLLGERADLSTTLEITDANAGLANTWTLNLASKLNREQSLLRSGQKIASGEISAVPGVNLIYAQTGSTIQRVEVQINKAISATPDLEVNGVNSSYPVVSGATKLDLSLTSNADMEATITVYDGNQRVAATMSKSLNKGSSSDVSLQITPAAPGTYSLVVVGKDTHSGLLIQKSWSLILEGIQPDAQYDYVFPQSLRQYKPGTRVLQPADGRIYECKPWPYSGYCVQWSAGSNQFEPGIGSASNQAWIPR